MRCLGPGGDPGRLDVPEAGKLGDMRRILPVAEPRQGARAAGLARILGRRLPIHLEHSAARPAEEPTDEVQIVDLDRRRSRLHRLINALEEGSDKGGGRPKDLRRLAQLCSGNPRHCFDALGRPLRNRLPQIVESQCMRLNVRAVNVPSLDHQMQQAVHDWHIRTGSRRKVDVSFPRGLGSARIDHDQLRRVGATTPVEDAHPQYGLLRGDIVADVQNGIRRVEIAVRAGLAITPEALAQCRLRRCRTQPGVAIHVQRSQPRPANDRQRVVLLKKELTGSVDTDGVARVLSLNLFRPLDEQRHGLVPGCLFKLAMPANQWTSQPVRAMICHPAMQSLRPQPPMVDAVRSMTTDANHPPVFDADVHPTAVRTEDARGLDPPIRLLDRPLVHADRPLIGVRCSCSPDIRNAISRLMHDRPSGLVIRAVGTG